MSVNYDVPFYPNTEDDTHCYQAAYKMVLKYFEPERDYTWEELERITAKIEGEWTWPMAGLIWIVNHGFDVVNIEHFDYPRFEKLGKQYLIEKYGQEIADLQDAKSNIAQEQGIIPEFLKRVKTLNYISQIQDIRDYLNEGYLLIVGINSRVLNEKPGYVGHVVVVKGITDTHLVFHDPGSPAQENRTATFEEFEKAWASPDEAAKNISAFKKP